MMKHYVILAIFNTFLLLFVIFLAFMTYTLNTGPALKGLLFGAQSFSFICIVIAYKYIYDIYKVERELNKYNN